MLWKTRRRNLNLVQEGVVLGILNVTPDSFSDGGQFFSPERAIQHALELEQDGATIIDVGGESTRPGSDPVPVGEEIERVVPVIRALRKKSGALISIDTMKAEVARAAMEAGADIINDVTAGLGDPAMVSVARDTGAGLILMHMQGRPKTMQQAPHYEDVVQEVSKFLRQRFEAVIALGIDPMCVSLDPGIGFGKLPEHNLQLFRRLSVFTQFERPVVIGHSRKSFLGWLAGSPHLEDRFWPGVALTSLARENGARIFRVHDPKPHLQALRMTEAILGHA